ncbi:unnamed protein product [Microthlaspi erraticum]|uniref:Pentatricopeptide repeat-containing protein n=1 Tax=Microthlaspi erraticum TaxID=1685480 RepID=A0A6D2I898_9BRAS|nr:unnamed protein product [Microthlaspi erraticum]
MEDAVRVLNSTREQDVFLWTSVVSGFVRNLRGKEAVAAFLELVFLCQVAGFRQADSFTDGKHEMAISVISDMCCVGIRMDQFCLPGFISASANLGALETGRHLHCHSVKTGYFSSVSVLNSLLDMYGKCGSLEDAKKAFEEIAKPDVVSWNGLLSGLASNGCVSSALSAFKEIRMKGTNLNTCMVTMLSKHNGT